MIQRGTQLKVADNSGAKLVECIGIPGYSNRKVAKLGDEIVCSVKNAMPSGTVRDHEIIRVVIARTRKEARRKDGSYIRFDDNAGIVVDKDKNPRGTRVFGPIAREVRDNGYTRAASMAPEIW